MKIRSKGPESFHAGGQTDMTKLIIVFRCSNETRCKQFYLTGTCVLA
jgi:hypothetical protein